MLARNFHVYKFNVCLSPHRLVFLRTVTRGVQHQNPLVPNFMPHTSVARLLLGHSNTSYLKPHAPIHFPSNASPKPLSQASKDSTSISGQALQNSERTRAAVLVAKTTRLAGVDDQWHGRLTGPWYSRVLPVNLYKATCVYADGLSTNTFAAGACYDLVREPRGVMVSSPRV